MNITKRQLSFLLKTFLLTAILVAGNHYLSHKDHDSASARLNSGALLSASEQAKESSNDVSPKNQLPPKNSIWLLAVDVAGSFTSSINQKSYPAPGLASYSPISDIDFYPRFIQTTAQVNTELGRLFTLVGERPSGTS